MTAKLTLLSSPPVECPCTVCTARASPSAGLPGQEKERSALLHTLGTVQALVSGSRQKPAGSGAEAGSTAAVDSLMMLQCRCTCWQAAARKLAHLPLSLLHACSWHISLCSPGWLSRNSATQVQVQATSDQLPAETSGAGKHSRLASASPTAMRRAHCRQGQCVTQPLGWRTVAGRATAPAHTPRPWLTVDAGDGLAELARGEPHVGGRAAALGLALLRVLLGTDGVLDPVQHLCKIGTWPESSQPRVGLVTGLQVSSLLGQFRSVQT